MVESQATDEELVLDNEESEEEIADSEAPIDEYDISAVPNDFNIATIFNFMESGAFKIPGFQRNFVWDIRRASKLIESIIMGLPVPQIFLYENEKNSFLVIDGQQRLMSIYYFIKQRFPKKERSGELRRIFDEHGSMPDDILFNYQYFGDFNLHLPAQLPGQANRFHRLNYATLGDHKAAFDLRTVRNVVIKQLSPTDDDSATFEIFSRLNSGGINVNSQELRRCMYESLFFEMLYRVNLLPQWRNILGVHYPDLHMKDVELLLRGFAMLERGSSYGSSMIKFLNAYAKAAKTYDSQRVSYLQALFQSFLDSCAEIPDGGFLGSTGRFSVTIFESVFYAACLKAFQSNSLIDQSIVRESFFVLKGDSDFRAASQVRTTNRANVSIRLERAETLLVLQSS